MSSPQTRGRRPLRAPLVTAAVVTLAAALPTLAVTPTYTLTDLSALGFREVNDINDRGDIAGAMAVSGGGQVAAVYRNGTFQTFGGIAAAADSSVTAINNNGQAVGIAVLSLHDVRSFYADGTSTIDLDALAGAPTTARDINDAGTAVGYFQTGGTNHAFVYSAGAPALTDLGTLGGNSATAKAINNDGTILGNVRFGPGYTGQAFTYTANGTGTLTLLPAPAAGMQATATDINASGTIVGQVQTGTPTDLTFFTQNGGYRMFSPIGGYTSSGASAINDNGQIVGSLSGRLNDPGAPFVFSDGAMRDLNSLVTTTGWQLIWARDINNQGQIIGLGRHDGQTAYFLATPNAPVAIPLPAAFYPAVATLGTCGTLTALRRRRRTALLAIA